MFEKHRKTSDSLHQSETGIRQLAPSVQAVKLKGRHTEKAVNRKRPGKWTRNLLYRHGVKFCPKCRSTRIGVRYLDPFSLQPKYYCKNCGFSGFLVPEIEGVKNATDLKKEVRVKGTSRERKEQHEISRSP